MPEIPSFTPKPWPTSCSSFEFTQIFLGIATVNHLPPSLFVLCISFFLTPTICTTSFTMTINLLFGLPIYLLPGTSFLSIVLPVSLHCTCPKHLNLASLTLSPKCLTSVLIPIRVHTQPMPKRVPMSLTMPPSALPLIFYHLYFGEFHHLLAIHYFQSYYPVIILSSTFSTYSFVTDHSWNSFPPTPPCPNMLLHLFTTVTVALKSWPQFDLKNVWNSCSFSISIPCNLPVPLASL